MQIHEFLSKSWDRYSRLTPDAPRIHHLLEARGEKVLNDHMAYRTFNLPGMGRLELGTVFEEWGYKKIDDDLDFPEKKLKANYWIHPDSSLPKVFISELLVDQMSPDLQKWIHGFTASSPLKNRKPTASDFLEPSWNPVRLGDYETFYAESEYAAWTAAFGIQLNHFTVFVNSLKSFSSLQELNAFLLDQGMKLNESGGIVKGTPEQLLEQSSTLARRIPWEFADDAEAQVMGCYYEFARRYPIPGTQELFNGFIPKSADKIFESTFEKKIK